MAEQRQPLYDGVVALQPQYIQQPSELERYEHITGNTSLSYLITKRVIDIIGSLFFLVLFSPIFLITAIAIKIEDPRGKIIYHSTRIGKDQVPFDFPKFRSMIADADIVKSKILAMNEKDGPIFKIKNDPRITKVGHFIRKYSIDELPQLICVLAGKMSLVGPRPPMPEEVLKYTEYEQQRLAVTPGLSCVWQISGRSELSFEQWMELDLEYIKNQNIVNDIKILIKTPIAVLRPRGAY
ncbi:multidrug MFS transporter [Clostridia bacterium]|nr:multidrug MFS transporter [Clostridia bacterium]